MSLPQKTLAETNVLADATTALGAGRLTNSGVVIFKAGESDYHRIIQENMVRLNDAAAGWLLTLVEDAASTVRVLAGRAVIGGVALVYAGGTASLAAFAGSTALLYLNDAGGGVAQIVAAASWPATPHVRLASVAVSAGGAITAITDLRPEALFLAADDLVRYALAISSQGSTAGPSTITITLKDRHGNTIAGTHYLRVRVCDSAGFANATNATIAAGANTTAVEMHTTSKDITFRGHTDGVITITLTDATAEAVTLRIGAPAVGGRRGDYTTSLNVTHA